MKLKSSRTNGKYMAGSGVLSCLLALYTAVMGFEIPFPFGLWVFEPACVHVRCALVRAHAPNKPIKHPKSEAAEFRAACCACANWLHLASLDFFASPGTASPLRGET